MILCNDLDGQFIGSPESISECPYCESDWFQSRKRHFDNDREASPFFQTLQAPTDGNSEYFTTSVWYVKCFECDSHWIQVLFYGMG